jgi:pimeloyl-ACP methyl ester carboxylesterase
MQKQVYLNNLKMNYEVDGSADGRAVLFVHGWGGSISSLKALHKLAVKIGLNSFILDLPGFGESDTPPDNWRAANYGEIVHNFIDTVIDKQVIYFGHSFGGGIGVYNAAKYPKSIDKLVLCNAAVRRDPKISRSAKLVRYVPFYSRFKVYFNPIRNLYYKLFLPYSDILKEPELESVFRNIVREDLTDVLSEIDIETLIVWGKDDKQTTLTEGKMINDKLSNSKLVVIDDTGHNLPLKHPELVFNEINKFINKQ